jgi:hypothetical protein
MSSLRTLFFVSCIVAAELTAFGLLQNSVDYSKHKAFNITLSILLFGLIVPLAFRETLKGNKIAIANLYWILASAIGSIFVGYFLYDQDLTRKEYISFALLGIATLYQVFG